MLLARVAVPVPLGRAFTYAVPEALASDVRAGARVLCEFGRRRVLGIVLEVSEREPEIAKDKLKPLRAVIDAEPVLPLELLEFLRELARYYIAPIGEVMRLALPAVERSAADELDRQGLLEHAEIATVGKMVQVARAAPAPKGGAAPRGTAAELLEHLQTRGPTPVSELERKWKSARAAVRRLERTGLVELERRAAETDPFARSDVARDVAPQLTPAQARATEAVLGALERGERRSFLLHGVTASGKTEIYLNATARCLELGGSVIVLVPEIALTPELVRRFRARLGDRIAVLHSALGDRERHAMWKRLRSGELGVAIGARSALFAPVERLRLVCVDEEHDDSFKQEEGVRYHARDMALFRAHRAEAVCVLGSATPSLASESLVRSGRLERLELPERATRTTTMPKVEVVDLRRVGPGPGGHRLISLPLYRELERVVAKKQQAILFLNRRGFSPSVICEGCGKLFECPSCSVSLTLHRATGDRLRCHYCDYSCPMPKECPECKSDRIALEGVGTERVEEALSELLPGARIARLDRDVAAGAKSARVLDRMRKGEIDVLVGTQMVAKGHDLPSVTLVGVLNADAALSMPDFRAAERTFHLLVQVAGRAGRGDVPGLVVIQTRQPDHPAIVFARQHDVRGFIERELKDREELGYPPFSRLGLVRVDAKSESLAHRVAQDLSRVAHVARGEGVRILGPAAAPLSRLRNRWRFHFLVSAAERAALRQTLLAVARQKADRNVRVVIDVDPVSML